MTPAMKARIALPLPAEFDVRKSDIRIFANWNTRQYVKTVQPPGASYRAALDQARTLWQAKYGVEMPEEAEEGDCAETTGACAFPHDGPTILTAEEQALIAVDQFGDFTLDMLWLMVEGLGWRPGKPVPEDDAGWLAVWAEEEHSGCYIDIIRHVLNMPAVPVDKWDTWKPPAVLSAYKGATNAETLSS